MQLPPNHSSFHELGEKLTALVPAHPYKIIAIDGLPGAGKSVFARRLRPYIKDAALVHIDEFYKPVRERTETPGEEITIDQDFNWERYESEILIPATRGEDILYQPYYWDTDAFGNTRTIFHHQPLLIEGVFGLQARFQKYYDYKIWIESPEAVRIGRALARDGGDRLPYWNAEWLPVERKYIEREQPHLHADLVVLSDQLDFDTGYFETKMDMNEVQ